jgi:hypothetical protein
MLCIPGSQHTIRQIQAFLIARMGDVLLDAVTKSSTAQASKGLRHGSSRSDDPFIPAVYCIIYFINNAYM